MAHNLMTVNGKDGYAGRQPAWHGLGTVTGDYMTSGEALEAAGLTWPVWVEPLTLVSAGQDGQSPAMLPADDYWRGVWRTGDAGGPPVFLGPVGSDYQPIQTADAFAFVDTVLDRMGEAHVETAFGLGRGEQVGMVVKSAEPTVLTAPDGRTDTLEQYLLMHTGHAGNASLSLRPTNVRVVCQNTLDMALGAKSDRVYRVRHTGTTLEGRVQEAREALGFAVGSWSAFDEAAQVLYATDFSDSDFDRALRGFLGDAPKADATPRAKASYDVRVADIVGLYRAPQNENVRGTAYGAWNAMTEWADWVRPVRGADQALARSKAILSSNGTATRDKALTAVLRAGKVPVASLRG